MKLHSIVYQSMPKFFDQDNVPSYIIATCIAFFVKKKPASCVPSSYRWSKKIQKEKYREVIEKV